MIIIQEKLVSDLILKNQFLCNLDACKGACCVEGDMGAPLEKEEVDTLNRILPDVLPYLTEAGKAAIAEQGASVYNKEEEEDSTSLIDGGACSFIVYDGMTAKCGIEQAYYDGKTDFKKPISCHLYPIRVTKNEHLNFEALNYDYWDICNPACTKGKEEKLPTYRFLKEPLIRKYGESFYEEMDNIARDLFPQDK